MSMWPFAKQHRKLTAQEELRQQLSRSENDWEVWLGTKSEALRVLQRFLDDRGITMLNPAQYSSSDWKHLLDELDTAIQKKRHYRIVTVRLTGFSHFDDSHCSWSSPGRDEHKGMAFVGSAQNTEYEAILEANQAKAPVFVARFRQRLQGEYEQRLQDWSSTPLSVWAEQVKQRNAVCPACNGNKGEFEQVQGGIAYDYGSEWRDCGVCGGTGIIDASELKEYSKPKRPYDEYSQLRRWLESQNIGVPSKELNVYAKLEFVP